MRQGSQGQRLAAMDRKRTTPGRLVQKRPLLKAALFATDIDDFARVALLRTYQKDDRLLVTVDRIGRQIENRRHASTSNTIERTWSSSRI